MHLVESHLIIVCPGARGSEVGILCRRLECRRPFLCDTKVLSSPHKFPTAIDAGITGCENELSQRRKLPKFTFFIFLISRARCPRSYVVTHLQILASSSCRRRILCQCQICFQVCPFDILFAANATIFGNAGCLDCKECKCAASCFATVSMECELL
jgi:hypothetical protein